MPVRMSGGSSRRIAVIVSADVARALVYAHERGVVHRDIKPDNVLLSGHTAVVTDFGIAKAIAAAAETPAGVTLTQLGTAIGTPAYMAPEQFDPELGNVSAASGAGVSGHTVASGSGMRVSCAVIVACGESPLNGCSPVRSSYACSPTA